jgi:hypothetical protein
MDHREAVTGGAAERYLLGQMSETEQRAFEEHFFECAECAADVEAGASLAANAAEVFAEEPAPPVRHTPYWGGGWRWPALAFCALLLALIGFYELVRVPGVRNGPAQAYPALFLHPVARGAGQVLQPPADARLVGLWFDVPPGAEHPEYECRLLDASGRTLWTVTAPHPRGPGEPVHLLVPAKTAPAGDYTLVLSAGGTEIQRFQFTLKLK